MYLFHIKFTEVLLLRLIIINVAIILNNKEIIFGIRPEDIHDEPIVTDTYEEAKYIAEIEVAELLGHESILYTNLAGQQLVAKVDARSDIRMGDKLEVALDMNKCHFFDVDTEKAIR